MVGGAIEVPGSGCSMKLMRVGGPGNERPALLDESGAIRDLSAHVQDISRR